MATFQRFRLVPLREPKIDEKDDWSGLRDAKERRKRQNRVNQRAARRRQRLTLAQEHESQTAASVTTCQRRNPVFPSHQVYFPLTPDHKLLYVIVLNVSRAVITNYFILCSIESIATTFCESRRVFALSDLAQAPHNLDGTPAIPPSFTPTRLQQEVAHPGWIDLFPSPQLRDNLIIAVEEFDIDEDEILADLIGDIFDRLGCSTSDEDSTHSSESAGDKEDSATPPPSVMHSAQAEALKTFVPSSSAELGILSWSDPWDISGWEFTEKFVTKWGFLLQGCPDVVSAANNWRTLRGEDPLIVEI